MLFVIGMAKGKECKIQCIRTSCVSLIPMPNSLFCSNVIASIEDLSMQRQRSFTYLTYQKPDIIHNMWDLGKLFLFKNFSTPKSFLLTFYMDFLGYFQSLRSANIITLFELIIFEVQFFDDHLIFLNECIFEYSSKTILCLEYMP